LIASRPSGSAVRPLAIGLFAVGIEWARVTAERQPSLTVPALAVGGLALVTVGLGVPSDDLGFGAGRLALRLAGGLMLGLLLVLPAIIRGQVPPLLPPAYSAAAIAVAVGEEIAFRGALYSALDSAFGPAAAIAGSSVAFVAAHVLSHPPAFLPVVATMAVLLAAWRWYFRDLLAPVVGHVLADALL
jgi:membrane protease YdiL (CAAX protease family)